MVNCKSCQKEHDGKYGSGKFCSRSCANKRLVTDEHRAKTSNSIKKRWIDLSEDTKRKHQIGSIKGGAASKVYHKKRLLNTDTEKLGPDGRRKKVLHEQGNKCKGCGLDNWLGKEMTYELNHIDGNNKNNKRENLEMICPNCHSLTPNWRGRKRALKNIKAP